VVLGAIVAVGATVMRNGRGDAPEAPALDPTRVLVDIFRNETGDPSLDPLGRMATDRVTAGLTFTTFVDVVSLGTQLLSREPLIADASALEHDDLQALARANGTGTVVWGSYYLQGDSLHFLAHVTNAATGEELAIIEPVWAAVGTPASAVEVLRDRVMTMLATLTDPRLAKWMRYASKPPTFEAYQEFVEGIELHTRYQRYAEAIPHFLGAAALDSNFTMASLWAVLAYGNAGQRSAADSLAQALDRRREQLAPLDRQFLDSHLARLRGDKVGILQAMRRLVEIAPGSDYLKMAGQAALNVNRPREAIAFLTQADPESGWLRGWHRYWATLTRAHHWLGDHGRELKAARRGRRQHPDHRQTLFNEIRALAALGRIEEVNALMDEGLQLPLEGQVFTPAYLTWRVAGELRAHGHRAAAAHVLNRGITWFERAQWYQGRPTPPETAGNTAAQVKFSSVANERAALAQIYYEVGRLEEAQSIAQQLNEQRRNTFGRLLLLARVAAREGDREEALAISRLLLESVVGQPRGFGTVGRAVIAAALGEHERAMALLHEARASGVALGDWSGWQHANLSLEPLWDYPPFQELMRPKG
jgi:tetratricopeptide (TPR) repeat protein